MRLRVLSGKLAGCVQDFPQIEGEVALATGYAERVDDDAPAPAASVETTAVVETPPVGETPPVVDAPPLEGDEPLPVDDEQVTASDTDPPIW